MPRYNIEILTSGKSGESELDKFKSQYGKNIRRNQSLDSGMGWEYHSGFIFSEEDLTLKKLQTQFDSISFLVSSLKPAAQNNIRLSFEQTSLHLTPLTKRIAAMHI